MLSMIVDWLHDMVTVLQVGVCVCYFAQTESRCDDRWESLFSYKIAKLLWHKRLWLWLVSPNQLQLIFDWLECLMYSMFYKGWGSFCMIVHCLFQCRMSRNRIYFSSRMRSSVKYWLWHHYPICMQAYVIQVW